MASIPHSSLPKQSHKRHNPCPICQGYDDRRLGDDRCYGFTSGDWVHCTNPRFAGEAKRNEKTNAWVHFIGERQHSKSSGRQIVATYDYRAPDGTLLFQTVRYAPKSFSYRRPDGKDGWIWNLQGVPRVLYRLPELLASGNDQVWIVEGEKDVENMRARDLVATCNVMGAGKWRDEYSASLKGRQVVIIPDNDDETTTPPFAGQKHAQQVAASLRKAGAASVKIITLPPEKGKDVSDYFKAGGIVGHLRDLAQQAPEWMPGEEEEAQEEAKVSRFTFIPASQVEDLPPMEWLIGGIIPLESTAAIWGPEGCGKSFVLLDMACCIATGQYWRDHAVQKQSVVAYIAGEGMKGMSLRLRAWRESHHLPKGAVDHLHMIGVAPQLLNPEDLEALLQALRALPEKPGLVVIDTLARCTAGADENGQKEMGLLVAAMDTIKKEFGAQVITAHHANANGDRMRGSTVLPGAFETIIKVSQPVDGLVQIECQKQKDGDGKFDLIALRLRQVRFAEHPNLSTCILVPADKTEVENAKLKVKKQLLELLYKQEGHAANSTKWEEAAKTMFSMKRGVFQGWRNLLLKEEYVTKGEGKRDPYCLTAKGLVLIGQTPPDEPQGANSEESPECSEHAENVQEHSEHYAQPETDNVQNVQRAISSEHLNISDEGEDDTPDDQPGELTDTAALAPDRDAVPIPGFGEEDDRPTDAWQKAIRRWNMNKEAKAPLMERNCYRCNQYAWRWDDAGQRWACGNCEPL